MKVSIFTPTHRPENLPETFRSLKPQQVDWEWVICPNGQAIGNIPEDICNHERVRIVPYHLDRGEEPKIGALKRFACDNCRGDVFVELDHDDMLTPDCLEKVARAVDKGAGFVYSDTAVFVEQENNLQPVGYSERYGWETYEIRMFGRDLLATRAFDAVPRAICEVYYAPDHVRAWTKEAYYLAGGHDKALTVGDDHDLICRTYLKGVKFSHTGSCGYIYRNHPQNTVKTHNKQIQTQQAANRDKYLYKLLDEWVRRRRLGYLDMHRQEPRVKINSDGSLRIKAEDASLGLIRCFDFLQFVAHAKIMQAMEEIYRVLVPGGWICLAVPSTQGQGAFAPHYCSYWNEYNINYFCDWRFAREMGIERPVARFQRVRCWTGFPGKQHHRAGVSYVYADLCALKGQRQPGLVSI